MLAAAGVLLAGGCLGGSEEPAERANAGDLATFYEQEPVWTGCLKMSGECAGVDVPLDYGEPEGRTLNLSIRRVPASGDAIGTLFFNPGGPGASGVRDLTWFARRLPGEVRERYDVVGFDPRGIADSEGLQCTLSEDPRQFRGRDYSPDTAAERRALVRTYEVAGQGCVESDPELARHMSTPEVARDLDVLRTAVGDDALTYVGFSYGTKIGAHYADQFPDRVGRMVLDGGVDPTLNETESTLDQARGYQRVLRGYLADCVRRGCPLGDTVPGIERRIDRFLAKLDAAPAGRKRLTESQALYGLENGLVQSGAWGALTRALKSAFAGDGTRLQRLGEGAYAYSLPPTPSSYAGAATTCLDGPDRPSLEQVRRSVRRFERASPVFGRLHAWQQAMCTVWPVEGAREAPEVDGRGADPILVIGSLGDPATPYRQSVALAEQLASGVLLRSRTYGHTVYLQGSRCVDRIVDAYLVDGDLPDTPPTC